jgi:hypothetical protein
MLCARILFGGSCFLASVAVPGCARQPQPAHAGEAVPLDSARRVVVDWYRGGSVSGEGETCYFVPADHSTPRAFGCGSLLIGLRRGVSRTELSALLEKLSATLVRDRTDQPDPWVAAAVRPGSELDAIERAYADPRVLYANLNWSGIVIRGGNPATITGINVDERVELLCVVVICFFF